VTVQAAAALAGAVIADLVIDPATTVADLNASLRENKPTIDWIGTIAPEIWQQLKLRTQSRRAQLARAAA
jgi:hypothetical protein